MTVESDKMYLRAMWTWFTLTCVHCARIAWYMGIILFVAATVALTVFRYWLPALSERKAEIETFVSAQIGQRVTIGEMSADWRGLYPSLHIKNLLLHNEDGKEEKIRLEEMSLSLDLVPLLQGRFVFHQMTLLKPHIEVTRTKEGLLRIGRLATLKKRSDRSGRDIIYSLLRQRYVVIQEGVIEWHDEMLKEPPLVISNININLENDRKEHLFTGTLTMPGQIPRVVELEAQLKGNPLRDKRWTGQLSSRVSDLDIQALPGVIVDPLGLSDLSGVLSVDLMTSWRDGIVEQARGAIEAARLVIPLGRFGKPLALRRFQTDLDLAHQDKRWQMRLGDTRLALTREPWRVGDIHLYYDQDEASVQLGEFRLERLRPVLDALNGDNKIIHLVKDLYPAGMAHNTRLVLYGPYKNNKPRDFLFEMYASDASINAHKIYPAATGLTGLVRVTKTGGLVDATARHSRVVLAKVYDHPLRIDQAKAKVTWEKGPKNWHIRNSDLWLSNADAEATAQFHVKVPLDKTIKPTMGLSVELRNGNLQHADRYFPTRLLAKGMNDWLAQLKLRGRASQVKLDYQGAVRGFPIKGAERFEVIANLEAASMSFMNGWPRVSGFSGDLVFSRSDMWLTGAATELAGQRVDDGTVHLTGLDRPGEKVIDVSTTLHGDTAPLVDFLLKGPLFRKQELQDLNMAGKGKGALSLKVSVPLDQPEKNTVEGLYRFKKADLKLPNDSWLTGLTGKLGFTDRSVTAKGIHGHYLGGDISIDINTTKPGRPPVVEITSVGTAQTKALADLTGEWVANGLQGTINWQGLMTLGDAAPRLHVSSDMSGVSSRFPAPLNMTPDNAWPLEVDTIFTSGMGPHIAFSLADKVNGQLYLPGRDASAPAVAGCIGIGTEKLQCSPGKGLKLSLKLPELETTPWLDYLSPAEGEEDGQWPAFMVQVEADIGRLNVSGVDLGAFKTTLVRQDNGYIHGPVDGDRIKGKLDILWEQQRRRVVAKLDRLVWNEGDPGYPDAASEPDPGTFPAMVVDVADMQFHGMQLGHMNLSGKPINQSWHLDSLRLQRPDMEARISGRWRGSPLNHVSSFDIDFTSTDMLATLKALDVNTKLDTDDFHATGYLSWNDTPFNFDFSKLNGALDVKAGKGNLSSVEVGAGRLLGALNVETLRRRLSLDFSDLFDEGFAFDEIDARMEIKLGQAHVTRFIMPGPAATIRMEGRLGLADEDIDMKMAVSPAVGGNLAVAGFALGGPAVGVATYLAQKAIQKQMNKSANYKYHVMGSWDDPIVEKLASPETDEQVIEGGQIGSE